VGRAGALTDDQSPPASDVRRRLESANPAVRALEAAIEKDFTADQIGTVKAWLVASALRLEQIS
jgi:hypothetical protein